MPALPGRGEVFDFSKTMAGGDAVRMLAKLVWEIGEIQVAKDTDAIVRMFRSANAASTAWHIHEWLWKCCNEAQRVALLKAVEAPSQNFKGYVLGIQKQSFPIAVCRQIATAGKHFSVAHNRGDIFAETEVNPDGEVNVYLISNRGRFLDTHVYHTALKFWTDAYIDLGLSQAEKLEQVRQNLFGEK